MKNSSLKTPAIILVIGLVLCIAASMLTGIVKAPVITEHDFPYSVTYTLNGETKTYEGVYRCQFTSTGKGIDPLERYYEGTYLKLTSEYHPAAYTIEKKDGLELCIITIFSNKYLMGDTKGEPEATFIYEPYLAVMDQDGVEYEDEETLSNFDAQLISWELPEPVENSFQFLKFSHLHDNSMFAMLIVGILVIIACMIFVKRDKTIPYKALDKISIVVNFIVVLVVIPIATGAIWFSQIVAGGNEFSFQLMLCIPVFTAFTVAASVSLRRKSYTKAGFFVQLVTPAMIALLVLL
jgi:hypothetical protein